MKEDIVTEYGRKLLQYGVLLFLLGLITGILPPLMKNPRMGLSSHLEGILNGMFLIIIGLVWGHLNSSKRIQTWTYGLLLYGTFTNWLTTFLAALWGAGAEMMPISGQGYQGAFWQEILIKFGLISLSLSMIAVCVSLIWGLRGKSKA